jgi:hypothetical protein
MADGLAAAGSVDTGFSAFMKSAKFRWLTPHPGSVCHETVRTAANLVGADYVGLAVVRDFLDLSFVKITLHLSAIESLRLSGQAHDTADLVRGGLALRAERRQGVNRSIASSVYRWK